MPSRHFRHPIIPALPLLAILALPPSQLLAQDATAPEAPLQVGAHAISVHSLLELEVVTADDGNLGQVYDLVADPVDGTLAFLVVQRDSEVFGIDFPFVGTRAAIPWQHVEVQDSPRLFRVALTLAEVESLPEWEGERTEGGAIGAAPMTD
jgi:sporulation protein YlmC with PRC-barrel domain